MSCKHEWIEHRGPPNYGGAYTVDKYTCRLCPAVALPTNTGHIVLAEIDPNIVEVRDYVPLPETGA